MLRAIALAVILNAGSPVLAVAGGAPGIEAPSASPATVVTMEPRFGPVGTRVVVAGTGFSANASLTITFDANAALAFSNTVGSSGNFSATFVVPAAGSGDHVVEVTDGTNTSIQSFVVTPEATVAPQRGYASVRVSVTGSGFASNGTADIYFDNETVQKALISPDGAFTAVFDTPPRLAGTYAVKISDGTNNRELSFATTTSASMTPVTSSDSPGFVGQAITIGGVGFVPEKDLTVDYDGKWVTTGNVTSDSNFSVTFNAPASVGGLHTVRVSDGVNIVPLKYYMDSTPPPPPARVAPSVGTSQNPMAIFKWSPVPDPSGVTYEIQVATDPNFDEGTILLDKSGLTSTEYKLPAEQKLKPVKSASPYFWRVDATDGASNVGTWSDTSYFTVGVPTPRWAPWMFIGLGAIIVVLFAFWLGRRSSSRPTGPSAGTGQRK